MGLIRKIFLAGCMLFSVQTSWSQVSRPVQQLIDYCKTGNPDGYSPRIKYLTLAPKGNVHYLFPFYNAFKDEEKFRKIYTDNGYYDELSQYFAFAGDYLSAMQYLVKSYDSVDDATRRKIFKMVEGLKDIEHVDARRYISFRAKDEKVIMINEAYAKPVHRAFTLSLLTELYRHGFRYLAMEMLSNNPTHTLAKLTMNTGYYAAEPVAGELVRTAISLGYTLVSYEDTAAAHHTPNQRDSIQAMNIYQILQKDPGAKILVHAAYAHISKKGSADGYVPMGLAFKNISGIDPLTIDQTDMSEEGNFGYGRALYQAYAQKYALKAPSVAMINNEPVNVTNNDLYDLAVIHPQASYLDGRPSWLTLDGTRQPFYIKPVAPAGGISLGSGKPAFLVQAYYRTEMENNENKPWQLVPADQSYIPSSKKAYLLYLKKGKYTVLFRDIDYHILNTLNIEVN
ncbi:MAG TPA: hypothetical protein VK563_14950 [Puia sp.]|nr:hypothetical protein [Puia sp.]